ncbi:unnamed protein product [Camellia sinensis]
MFSLNSKECKQMERGILEFILGGGKCIYTQNWNNLRSKLKKQMEALRRQFDSSCCKLPHLSLTFLYVDHYLPSDNITFMGTCNTFQLNGYKHLTCPTKTGEALKSCSYSLLLDGFGWLLLYIGVSNKFLATVSHEIRTPINGVLGKNVADANGHRSGSNSTGHPIAISAARKVKHVFANDLNPFAVEYLERNCVLNKLERKIEVFNMDGRRFIDAMFASQKAQSITQVVMNLPNDAAEYLGM